MNGRCLHAVSLVVCLISAAASAQETPGLVVLDFEAKGATALQTEAASRGVARGLRELDVFQVLTSEDVRQLLALERTRQLLGTEKESAALQDMAKILGARHAIAGTVTKQGDRSSGDKLTVELRLLDTEKSRVIAQKNSPPLPNVEALASRVGAMAQELVSPLLQEHQGTLQISTLEEGAEVVLDDVLVASTPMRAPLHVTQGMHRLQVRKDGFIAQAKTVRIQKSELTKEELNLIPSADYREAYQLRHKRLRVGAYLATAVALGAFAGAFVMDRTVAENTYRTQFLPRQLGLGQDPLPEAMAQDTRTNETYLECRRNLTACSENLDRARSSIQLQQGIALGLVGLGVVSTGVATYLWLTGKDPNRYAERVTIAAGPGGFHTGFSWAWP